MKQLDLEKHLKSHGCSLKRNGANHDIWENESKTHISAVPRHREIKKNTANAICKQLGIPAP